MKVGFIGFGAIAQYVAQKLPEIDGEIAFVIVRPGREDAAKQAMGAGIETLTSLSDARADVVVDCAGHAGLREHGAEILRAGIPLVTVSIGALADDALRRELTDAAVAGGTQLHLSTGAIGGLDAIASAQVGKLEEVTYKGRKPPKGWKGSPAEDVMDLDNPGSEATVHFEGTAREAALKYPKNANVAAAVALAGLGFDDTGVQLIADPNVDANIHEITARGDFGELTFTILGKTLPDNTRTSALAAMSVVKMIADRNRPIRL
ncbi:aspartate dehydrogenase [Aliiroseovarius sp. S1339]|uniref:aspartate dehydrogenase n=1 Tax=Aliiroseovarius sp. S1339 TaxID=2936990 RepID=UPI0020C028E0|nr:aspartate dehydrogenase [Aliiroseovarius sp. S1339]